MKEEGISNDYHTKNVAKVIAVNDMYIDAIYAKLMLLENMKQ